LKKLCCKGPFGAVRWYRRHTRRSALWSSSSSFCFCLQHSCILRHWVIECCFTELIDNAPTAHFHCRLNLLLQGLAHWNIRRDLGPFSDLPNSLGDPQERPSFVSQSQYRNLRQFKKDVSNSATQDLIMNIHNKAQLTYARINCILKGSSCHTPLSKILKLTILASNASSSSTKVFKCPHTKNDYIFTHNGFNHLKF
ncbi:hypothetical protein H5410_005225, partial [Solanum commersonii]